MTTPTQWAWDVPLPPEAAPTRVVLLALAEFSSPILPGSPTVRLGVVDPTHPVIAETADMDREQVARHVAALTRADVLIPAPTGPLVRFNEAITAASRDVATTISDTLAVLPETVPTVTNTTGTATAADEGEQDALVDVPDTTSKRPTKAKKRAAAAVTPEQAAAKDILAWWWKHWTQNVSPVSNGRAFSAHAKRVALDMLTEGYPVEAIKDAFVAVDQPLPPEFAVRNHLRAKRPHGGTSQRGSAANRGASQQGEVSNPFTDLAGVG